MTLYLSVSDTEDFLLNCLDPEDGSSKLLRNFRNYFPMDTTKYSKRRDIFSTAVTASNLNHVAGHPQLLGEESLVSVA
jgi:hypothetical protein